MVIMILKDLRENFNSIKKKHEGLLAKMEVWVDTLFLFAQSKEGQQHV